MSKQFSNSKFTHKIKWERKLVQAKNAILKRQSQQLSHGERLLYLPKKATTNQSMMVTLQVLCTCEVVASQVQALEGALYLKYIKISNPVKKIKKKEKKD